jgi:hypothetical protein
MTAAELRAWQRRCGLHTDAEAAHVLGLSVKTYRRKCTGHSPIRRQTDLLAAYYEVYSNRWLDLAQAARLLATLTRIPLAPAVAQQTRQLIAEVTARLDELT